MSSDKTPPRYSKWLEYVFDRPVTQSGWYFDSEDTDFDADEIELTALVTHTLENCGSDLAAYSEAQINHGLQYIFDGSCSQVAGALMSDNVPIELRLQAVSAIKFLYRDCFSLRCAPVLGHIGESGANSLNYICYMLWDVSPLSYWERTASPDKEVFYNAVVDVLEDALNSTNPACVESALHGLGHILSSHIGRVPQVISAYQKRNLLASSQLKLYAQSASVGRVL
ncbi:hypothetical protein ACO0LO_18760 [Undibacterium sp. TJN25]|uniref:hypothetical protein n=1 Tax=Undibacterium sp. TJN25 TaxID=3413056 RepID=UPI003BF396A8